VRLEGGGDGLGQQYRTPREAVLTQGMDLVIVGRGITQAPDPASIASTYREAAFSAYRERISA